MLRERKEGGERKQGEKPPCRSQSQRRGGGGGGAPGFEAAILLQTRGEAGISLQPWRGLCWADTTLHTHFARLQAAMARRKLQPVQRPEGICPVLEKIPGRSCGPWRGACAGALCEGLQAVRRTHVGAGGKREGEGVVERPSTFLSKLTRNTTFARFIHLVAIVKRGLAAGATQTDTWETLIN